MSFQSTAELHEHYTSIQKRLKRGFKKQRWYKPTVELVWWIPKVHDCRIAGLTAPSSIHSILCFIAIEHNVDWKDIIGPGRRREYVRARQHFYYLALKNTLISINRLAGICNRDHASVTWGTRRHAKLNNFEYPRREQFRPKWTERSMNGYRPQRDSKGRFLLGSKYE